MVSSGVFTGNMMYCIGAIFICIAVIVLCIIVRMAHKIVENQKRIIEELEEIEEDARSSDTRLYHIYDAVDYIRYDMTQRINKHDKD